MLILAHDCTPRGVLEVNGVPMPNAMIARKCGCDVAEFELLVAELDAVGVVSRTRSGSLYSRRMVRDSEKMMALSQTRSEAGKAGAKRRWGDGNRMANAMANAMANNGSSSSSSNSIPPLPPKGGGLSMKAPAENPKTGPPRPVDVGKLRQKFWLDFASRRGLDPDDFVLFSMAVACALRAAEVVARAGGNRDRLMVSLVEEGLAGNWSKIIPYHDRAKALVRGMREQETNQPGAQSSCCATDGLAETLGVKDDP